MNVEDYHNIMGGRRVIDMRFVDVPPAPHIRAQIAAMASLYGLTLGQIAKQLNCSPSTLSITAYGRGGYKTTERILHQLDNLLKLSQQY